MEDSNTYILLKDALKSLNVKERPLQIRCQKLGLNKTKEGYQIPIDVFNQWSTKQPKPKPKSRPKSKKKDSKPKRTNATQLDIELEALRQENETLTDVLKHYELADNERLEIFTHENYTLFEQRLKEWETQRKELEHQEQLFTAEKKSLSELYEHYKNQFHYQQKQNEKVLEMHQKLLDIISSQSKSIQERNLIEAVEKDIVKKDTWKPK